MPINPKQAPSVGARTARRPPPRSGAVLGSATPVALGLAVQAVTTYLTLVAAGRLLGPAEFAGLGALYVLVSSIATGLFLPLEQEIARRRGAERESRTAERRLVGRALAAAAAGCALLIFVLVLAWESAVDLLDGEPALVVALVVAVPGYAACFVSRGALSGSGRLQRYGAQLAVEGTFRLMGLAALAVVDVYSAVAYGWLFALAPWVALAVSLLGLAPGRPEVPATISTPLLGHLVFLLVSSVAAQVLIGAGPVVAQRSAEPGEAALVGAFLAALVVIRLPVLLFTAVQPSVLPAMSAHAEGDRKRAFFGHLRRILGLLLLVALATTVLAALLGPWGLRLLFGPEYRLSSGVFLLMGCSVGIYLVASVIAQSLIALGRHGWASLGWIVGVAGLAVGTALPDGPVLQATWGLLAGASCAAAALALALARAARHWTVPLSQVAGPAPGAPA